MKTTNRQHQLSVESVSHTDYFTKENPMNRRIITGRQAGHERGRARQREARENHHQAGKTGPEKRPPNLPILLPEKVGKYAVDRRDEGVVASEESGNIGEKKWI